MRLPRLKPDQPLTYYHVMTRTAQQSFLLAEDHDPGLKARVDKIIKAMAEVYYVRIFAHVYLDNHYHLAISVSKPGMDPGDLQERFERLQRQNAYPAKWNSDDVEKVYARFTDLSRFMGEINRRIAIEHNRKQETTGHFWGGRFKSIVIEDEDALLRVMTYIEQNPVRANICEYPSEYQWCSAGQAQQRIEIGTEPVIPGVHPFHSKDLRQRAEQYICWMDYQADLMIRPERVSGLAVPSKITEMLLTNEQLIMWRKEFSERKPSNWCTRGYGSERFEENMAAAIRAKLQQT
jgi:REP element-mobilizing transposase RayT